jgi:hypothetical protein
MGSVVTAAGCDPAADVFLAIQSEAVMTEKRWIAETLFDGLGFRMSYQVERVL